MQCFEDVRQSITILNQRRRVPESSPIWLPSIHIVNMLSNSFSCREEIMIMVQSMMIVRQSIAEVTRVGVSCVGKWGDLNLLTTSWSSSSSWTLIKTLPKHWKHWKRQQNLAASASDLNLLTTSWFVFNTWRKMMKRQKKSCSKWPLSRNNSYSSILSTLLRILIFLFKKNDID